MTLQAPRSGWIAFAAVVLGGLLAMSTAMADVTVTDGAGVSTISYCWNCPPGQTANPPGPCVVFEGPSPICPPFQIASCSPGNGVAILKGCTVGGITSSCITKGNIKAGGGFQLEAVSPDSTFGRDSMTIAITRPSGAGTLTLNNFRGELRNNPGALTKGPVSTRVIVAVYPDTATSKLDVNRTGVGALFFGEVHLVLGGNGYFIRQSGGFSGGDFVLTSNPDGSGVVTPSVSLSKPVSVTNGTNAAVVMITDDASADHGATLPATTPILLGLLAVLMLGGALWVLRSQRARLA